MKTIYEFFVCDLGRVLICFNEPSYNKWICDVEPLFGTELQ